MKEILQAIPEKYRGNAYVWFGVLGVLLGAIAAGYATAGVALPVAVKVALGVYAFLGGPVAATAKANVPATKP